MYALPSGSRRKLASAFYLIKWFVASRQIGGQLPNLEPSKIAVWVLCIFVAQAIVSTGADAGYVSKQVQKCEPQQVCYPVQRTQQDCRQEQVCQQVPQTSQRCFTQQQCQTTYTYQQRCTYVQQCQYGRCWSVPNCMNVPIPQQSCYPQQVCQPYTSYTQRCDMQQRCYPRVTTTQECTTQQQCRTVTEQVWEQDVAQPREAAAPQSVTPPHAVTIYPPSKPPAATSPAGQWTAQPPANSLQAATSQPPTIYPPAKSGAPAQGQWSSMPPATKIPPSGSLAATQAPTTPSPAGGYTFGKTSDGNIEVFKDGNRVGTYTADTASKLYGYPAPPTQSASALTSEPAPNPAQWKSVMPAASQSATTNNADIQKLLSDSKTRYFRKLWADS